MQLKQYAEMGYHPLSEKIVSILRNQTQNTKSDTYFRTVTSFFLAQMASSMRTYVSTQDRGDIPVNLYACCLMESGGGKGHSLAVLEDTLVHKFKERFTKETFPAVAEKAIEKEAVHKCQLHGTDFEEELDKLNKEFDSYGSMPYTFSEGTVPAYKQIRTKAQIATIGSLNYIVDEIGSNLAGGQELWTVCLETYDTGKVKDKITKASSENKRHEQRDAPVPANMLAFGTPVKLLDGGATEQAYLSFLETGYGRRFMFGVGDKGTDKEYTAEELFDLLTTTANNKDAEVLADLFENLADEANFNRTITLDRNESIMLIQYKLDCEALAEKLPTHQHIRRAELQHRYFKVLKLAGAYAFVDSTANVTETQLYAAMKAVEDSGIAFNTILNQPKNYVRLAQYLASVDVESTLADIAEDLSFFPSAKNKQEELLSLAISWGYRNNVIIKRSLMDGIEFFSGESLAETDLDQLLISYTHAVSEQDSAYGYMNKELKWDQIHQLCQAPHYHWLNHHLTDGHRQDESIMAGSNLLVLDLDGGTSLTTAKTLLEGYKAYIYTTKRHTEVEHRFRIVMPLKYTLKLSKADYKEFVNNIREFLPFDTDECSNQRSKKWLCHKGHEEYVEGDLFDPLPFIPKTKKNTQRQADARALGNMDKVEQYFAKLWNNGRNNTLLRYGTMLLDSGLDLYATQQQVIAFNGKFSDPLGTDELNNSVFKTLSKKVTPDV
jgi:hypothetical protein